MQISDFGLDLIKAFEGYYARPYRCPAGVLTQGYGHTAAAGPPALGGEWSRDYATEVLARTVADRYAAPVEKLLARKPTQAQFDALVSFAYNVGVGNFQRSSVLRHFNAGRMANAQRAFAMWTRAAGREMAGLTRRRASEALVFAGVKDLDFDGRRDPDEPVYGPMPQAVDANPLQPPREAATPVPAPSAPARPALPQPGEMASTAGATPARPSLWSRLKSIWGP